MKLKTLLVIFLFVSCLHSFSQNKRIDSLKAILITAKEDTSKIKTASALGNVLMSLGNLDSALIYSRMAESLALTLSADADTEKAKKGRKALGYIYNDIGYIYEYKGEYTSAISYYSKALDIKEQLQDERGIASTLTYMGLIYSQIDISKAITQYLKALKIYEKICNSPDKNIALSGKNGIAALYNNIGIIYLDQNDYTKALDYYHKALQVNQEINNKAWIGKNYSNIGIIYTRLANYTKALEYALKGLKIDEEINKEESIGHSLYAIGDIYFYRKEYGTALSYFTRALQLFEKTAFKRGIASCYNNIGTVYLQQKKYTDAEGMLQKALALSKEIGGWEGIRDANYSLSDLFSETNQYNRALAHYKEYVIAKDSLVNSENVKKTVQAQMQYEFDKKEMATKAEQDKKDVLAAEEKRKQQIIILSVSVGLCLVFILSLVILRSLKINQKKNRIITMQKQVVEHQKNLVEEKQKEIIDSIYYASRIQNALLTPEKYIERKLNKLIIK